MKNKMILLTAAAVLAALTTQLSAQPGPGRGGRFHRGAPEDAADLSEKRKELIEKYDASKDGQLDESERAALRADIQSGKVEVPPGPIGRFLRLGPPPEVVAKYDANKDGQLDEAERAAVRADVESGELEKPPFARRPHFRGGGGDNAEERAAARKQLLEKYDANENGQLDEEERAAIRADIESGKLPRPEFKGRGHGPVPPNAEARAEMLEKYDANDNGQLDEAERAKLHEDIRNGVIKPPFMTGNDDGQPPVRRGGGPRRGAIGRP